MPCAPLLSDRRWAFSQNCRAASATPSISQSASIGAHAPSLVPSPAHDAQQLPQPGVLPPLAAYNNIVSLGVAKAAMPAWKTLLMGIMAGCYISFGGFLAVTIAGMCAGVRQDMAASNTVIASQVTQELSFVQDLLHHLAASFFRLFYDDFY